MTFGNNKSWNRQDVLKKKYNDTEVPSLEELNNMISAIHFGKDDSEMQTYRARALIALYYLTAGRLTEITYRTKAIFTNKIRENGLIVGREKVTTYPEFKGIRKKDISFDYIDDRQVMYVRIENRKNKNRTTKKQPIPISLEKDIVRHITSYIEILNSDDLLFDFGNKRATQIINQTIKFNPHFIRHIRATHLITLYDFNEQTLIEFMGWSDARPAKHYMELSKKDLFRAFYKNK